MRKKPSTWRLNNMLLKNQWVNEEIKKGMKKYFDTMTRKTQPYKIYGMQQKQFLEGSS